MKITISDSASKWFQDEMGLSAGNGVRFYGKVYGSTPVHEGFSLALTRDDHPHDIYSQTIKDGISYYINQGDEWFFKGYDFGVDYDPNKDKDSVIYSYTPNGDLPMDNSDMGTKSTDTSTGASQHSDTSTGASSH